MRSSLVVVGGERQGKADAPAVAVEVQDDLLDPARIGDEEVDVLDLGLAFRQPRVMSVTKCRNAPSPLIAPAYRVMHLGHARERLDERVDLPGHQAVEEGHRSEALAPVLVAGRACSAGAEKSSGAQGTPQAFHGTAASAVHRRARDLTGGGDWA